MRFGIDCRLAFAVSILFLLSGTPGCNEPTLQASVKSDDESELPSKPNDPSRFGVYKRNSPNPASRRQQASDGEIVVKKKPTSRMLSWADFVGEVKVRHIEGKYGSLGTAGTEAILSDVEFDVINIIKDRTGEGADGALTLTFVGGKVGDEAMISSESPVLDVGDHLVIFAKTDGRPYPIYSGRRGLYRIRNGRVYNDDNLPIVASEHEEITVLPVPDGIKQAPDPVPVGNARFRRVSYLKEAQRKPLMKDELLVFFQDKLAEVEE